MNIANLLSIRNGEHHTQHWYDRVMWGVTPQRLAACHKWFESRERDKEDPLTVAYGIYTLLMNSQQ